MGIGSLSGKLIKFQLFILVLTTSVSIQAADTIYSKGFADAIIARHSNINNLTGKGWEYSNSIVLVGIEKLYHETGNIKYLNYIKNYIDNYVDNTGNISFNADANNLDHLHPGLLLILLYEEFGTEKYKLAADKIRAEFDNQPRNPSGGFWHKQNYPNQMWADGIYMAEPFLMRYGAAFDDLEYASDEATKQVILLADHAYDSTKNLLVHGWDESLEASWADNTTGKSPEIWSRGMGWYCMALVDILDYLPTDHTNYNRLIEILQGLAVGIKDYQDEESGLWYQVVDKGDLASNWLETSGSSMFVYTLKKAIDNDYIDSVTYTPVVNKGWEGLKNQITFDNTDRPIINQFVWGMGIKEDYETYVAQTVVSTPDSRFPHGYCGILQAASIMEFPLDTYYTLELNKDGWGSVVITPEQDEYLGGTEVSLSANPAYKMEFSGWIGDTISSENPLTITIDSNISITAVFIESTASNIDFNTTEILNVYPTRADEMIQLRAPEDLTIKSIKVFNASGQQLLHSTSASDHYVMYIDVSDFPSGVYTIVVNSTNKAFTKKFIKQ